MPRQYIPRVTLLCAHCGKQFSAIPTRKFCSMACSALARTVDIATRLWAKVDKNGPLIRDDIGPCWVWTATKCTSGYGQIKRGGKHGECVPAHRVVWELTYGPIPDGMYVLHKCDNRTCVRPSHLFLGTHLDNMRDMMTKGRGVTAETRGRWVRNAWVAYPDRMRRGSRSASAKLTDDDVQEIIERRASGEQGIALARIYGVSPSTISRVVCGHHWPPVP